MTRKTDSPNTRRNHFLYRADKGTPKKSLMQTYADVGASPNDLSKMWDAAAREALQLKRTVFNGVEAPDISFDALTRAFETFKLDPADPLDWRLLLNHLAYIQFGKQPKKARTDRKKWTQAKEQELRAEIKPLGKLSDRQKSLRLAKDKKSAFFGWGVAGLEKKIGELRRSE